MKRTIPILAIAALAATSLFANTATVDGITWNYRIVNGGAEICTGGTAAIPTSTTGAITIPYSLGDYPVTGIGADAFYCCSGLTGVTIPNSVTSIGDWAFAECRGLTSVTIPDSVTSIGNYAFSLCSGLTSVTIPDSVTSIGESAFSGCSGLTSVTIPNSVTSIGDWAFDECSGLTSMTIPDSVTSIGRSAFRGCRGLADSRGFIIVRDVLYDCIGSLTSATIPDGVTSIGKYAFNGHGGLRSVRIPLSVTNVGENAFGGCDLFETVYVGVGDVERVRGLMEASDLDASGLRFVQCMAFDFGEDIEYDAKIAGGAVNNLPPGLKYDPKTGIVSGIPSKSGIYEVALKGKDASGASVESIFEMRVANLTDSEIPVADSYGPFVPGVPVAIDIPAAAGCSVGGLPSGMKWTVKALKDKMLGEIAANSAYGAPTKPGHYTVTFMKSLKEPDERGRLVSVKHTATATFTVGPLPVLSVDVDSESNMGKVTGGGSYPAGRKVTVKATASKNHVFAGWNGDLPESEEPFAWLNPSLAVVTGEGDQTLEANFMHVSEDWLCFNAEGEFALDVGQDVVDAELDALVRDNIGTGSYPTVKVGGLPAGIKFDAKTMLLSGAATKAGVYFVTVSLKNAGGYVFDQTLRFVVGGAELAEKNEIGENWGVDFSSFDYIWQGENFEWSAESWMELKVAGLPKGLSVVRNAWVGDDGEPYDTIAGIPEKPGRYTLKFTMKDPADGVTLTTAKTIIVNGGESHWYGADDTADGTVSGSKVYAMCETVKLAAKPAKGKVFSRWRQDDDDVCIDGIDPRNPSLAFMATEDSPWGFFEPVFIDAMDDKADDFGIHGDSEWYIDGGDSEFFIEVDSLSYPKVTVKGLPAGTEMVQASCTVLRVKDKTKLRPGRYTITVTAENRSKAKRSADFTAIVANLTSDVIHGLDSSDEGYEVYVGEEMPTFDIEVDDGWTLSASGLPSGIKLITNHRTGLCCSGSDCYDNFFAGIPTKAGTYTVTFTAKQNGMPNEVATAFITVKERPAWAVGTFGGVRVKDNDGGFEGPATITVDAKGNATGKGVVDGRTGSFTWTFDRHYTNETGAVYFAADVNNMWGPSCQGPYAVLEEGPDGLGLVTVYMNSPFSISQYILRDDYDYWQPSNLVGWQNAWKRKEYDLKWVKGSAGTLENGLKMSFDGSGNVKVAGGVKGARVSGSFPLAVTAYSKDGGTGDVSATMEAYVSFPEVGCTAVVEFHLTYSDGSMEVSL